MSAKLVSFTELLKARLPQRTYTAEDVERFKIGMEKYLRSLGATEEQIRKIIDEPESLTSAAPVRKTEA